MLCDRGSSISSLTSSQSERADIPNTSTKETAEGKVQKELLGELMESVIFEEDFNEELKFKLALAIMDDNG